MPVLTPEDFVLLRRAVDIASAVTTGHSFTVGEATIRAALFPEAVMLEYQALGKQLGIEPTLLPAVLVALGGSVLVEDMRLREVKALEVPNGAPLN